MKLLCLKFKHILNFMLTSNKKVETKMLVFLVSNKIGIVRNKWNLDVFTFLRHCLLALVIPFDTLWPHIACFVIVRKGAQFET